MMKQQKNSPSRGRPRDVAKRRAIIDAGRALFAAGGTRHVTVEEVIARAQVSRGTFYANFADTDALLEAVVRRESDRIVNGAGLDGSSQEDLRTTLLRFGTSLLTFLSDPEMHSFEHRLASEVETHPELARRFFQAGPARAHSCLLSVVSAAMDGGELTACNAREAVGDLIGLWQGFHRMELLFHVVPVPSEAETRKRAARGVDLFLRLYARKKSGLKTVL